MLSWICPECGRENDPAYQECQFCTPGLVKRQPAPPRRAGRRQGPLPAPVSLTFETDYGTAPFIDPAALGLTPPTRSSRLDAASLASSGHWQSRMPRTAVQPPPPALDPTPVVNRETTFPDSPFIDPAELYLHLPLREGAPAIPDADEHAGGRTIDIAYEFIPQAPSLRAPAELAPSVDWQPRTQMSAARPRDHAPAMWESTVLVDIPTESPSATALSEPVTTALAVAPKVESPLQPFVFRTLALLDKYNPLPWSISVGGLAQPRPAMGPDHSWVLGMESDLLRLLETLRQSPHCALLDGGSGDAPVPARRQDLEYIPAPRNLASAVAWRTVVRAANFVAAPVDIPVDARKWPGRRGRMPRSVPSHEGGVPLNARAETLFRLWVRPERRPPARTIAQPATAAARGSAGLFLPAALRGFHENGLLASPPAMRVARKAPVPGWMVSLLTALVIILISTWVLEKSAFERFGFPRVEASSVPTSDAAQSAFPTISKYVEVTGVRASAEVPGKFEIRYMVVNHSAAELPPFLLNVKLHPRRGGASLGSFSATVQGMGPNESRELQTTIAREKHSYDLPEWRDLRVEAHVTAKQ